MQPTLEQFITYSAAPQRPPLRWPDNARLALWIAPNIEYYEYQPTPTPHKNPWPRVPHPDVMHYSYRDYGNRVGFWRMLEVFDQYRMPATVSLNLAVMDHFPEVRDAMLKRDWELMSHGIYNTRQLFGLSMDEERAFYKDCIETLKRHTGRTLKGMLGPAFTATVNTPDLMAEAGLIYTTDWFIDDQPFPLKVKTGRLINVPYSREINDSLLFQNPSFEGDYFFDICKRQFDVLYEEGAESGQVMCIALHPYLIGQPHRIKYLAQIFDYIASFRDVWITTAENIAEHYYRHYYDAEVARLAKSATGAKEGS